MLLRFCLSGCLAIILLFLVVGCTKNGITRGLYEGIRTRNQLDAPPAERTSQPDLTYDQYQQARPPAK